MRAHRQGGEFRYWPKGEYKSWSSGLVFYILYEKPEKGSRGTYLVDMRRFV